MRRDELRGLLREASRIIPRGDFLIIGSTAILASYAEEELPEVAMQSREADIALLNDPEHLGGDQLEQSGWGSEYHQTNGVYLDPVWTETAVLPPGWEQRMVEFEQAWALDPLDLCSAKLARNDPKDREFVFALVDAGLVDPRALRGRFTGIKDERLPAARRRAVGRELQAFVARPGNR